MSEVTYPVAKYRYRVEIEGIGVAGFSEVSGYEATIDATDYREGNMAAPTPIKVPGVRKYSNITLKWGVTSNKDMYSWMSGSFEGAVTRKTMTIVLIGDDGKDVASWMVINAWPVKYAGPDFNATSSDVAIEQIDLAHEGLTRK